MGAGHVEYQRRVDPVQFVLEDRDSSSDRIYIGQTPSFRSTTAEDVWQIRVIHYDGSVIRTFFANDAKYNCVWDNRASYFTLPVGPALPGGGSVSISGDISAVIKGVSTEGRITEVTLTNAGWTPLPATPLAGRQVVGLQNFSGDEIAINYDILEPAYKGIKLKNLSERYYQAADTLVILARLKTLASAIVTVEELA